MDHLREWFSTWYFFQVARPIHQNAFSTRRPWITFRLNSTNTTNQMIISLSRRFDLKGPIWNFGRSRTGGIPAQDEHGRRLSLYVGIIDILQSYQLRKKLEHTLKSVMTDGVNRHSVWFRSTEPLVIFRIKYLWPIHVSIPNDFKSFFSQLSSSKHRVRTKLYSLSVRLRWFSRSSSTRIPDQTSRKSVQTRRTHWESCDHRWYSLSQYLGSHVCSKVSATTKRLNFSLV